MLHPVRIGASLKARHFPRLTGASTQYCETCGWMPFYEWRGRFYCSKCHAKNGSPEE